MWGVDTTGTGEEKKSYKAEILQKYLPANILAVVGFGTADGCGDGMDIMLAFKGASADADDDILILFAINLGSAGDEVGAGCRG